MQEVLCITQITLHLQSITACSVSTAGRAGAYLQDSLPHLSAAMLVCHVMPLVCHSQDLSEVSRSSELPCNPYGTGYSFCMTLEN